ncbi:Osmotin, thaumatin-like protein [Pseudovirgaria hyperparasitica]|uniref:Osmotin, thaumatin-like protein n=1 Tax=Pseudovirgaria hyperparasitica TaxID=470096 RepID=A0A6A6W4B5_9PEZI|nr:Osmotin, thaumatin-like protein [Pseudovirgaria hyperparasitica]KAF2757009.1 Osmotin, thaumatin-like protein [Pseudovirgaria hyperparasitica]
MRSKNRQNAVLAPQSPTKGLSSALSTYAMLLLLSQLHRTNALHHMKRTIPNVVKEWVHGEVPLIATNNCEDDVYPAVLTQHGQGPDKSGFKLEPGETFKQIVSGDWQGRMWGRTNCSFNDDGTGPADASGSGRGKACLSGDCNGVLNCVVTGDNPATLAEFTYDGGDGLTYYDISLVDGYNIPIAIVMTPRDNSSLADIPPNYTNPSCQGTAAVLAPTDYDPYSGLSGDQFFLGTNSSFPLPFDSKASGDDVQRWCPWDLQVNPPYKPGNGIYPYPDDNIERPAFNPCFSACAKWNKDFDCCIGDYGVPSKCSPGLYSRQAKKVCPDAYSYAFDDQTSTFIIPVGAGFEVVFCPGARSTNILAEYGDKLRQLAQDGHVDKGVASEASMPRFPEQTYWLASGLLTCAALVSWLG